MYNSRSDASDGEKRIKRVLDNLDIRIKYFNKKECFVANDEELEQIYNEMEKHTNLCERNIDTDMINYKLEIEKAMIIADTQIKIAKIKIVSDLYEKGKLTFEYLERFLNT